MANIRVFGMAIIGLGAVVVAYLCVDMFAGDSGKTPKKPATHRVADHVSPENAKVAELRERVQVQVKAVHEDSPTAPAHEDLPAEHPPPDRSAELHATLEAEYARDTLPTRASIERERVISQLFLDPELQGKGALQEVSCRESMCRGVIKIASEAVDNEVFGRTFLSPEFDRAVSDAISVASREKMGDGSIRATFFIHPQGVLDLLPPPE